MHGFPRRPENEKGQQKRLTSSYKVLKKISPLKDEDKTTEYPQEENNSPYKEAMKYADFFESIYSSYSF